MITALSGKIKEARKKLSLTQEQLAHRAQVSYTTLTKIESGVIKNPSLAIVAKLTNALNIPLDNFLLVMTEHDEKAIFKIWEDILLTLPDNSEMFITGVDEKLFVKDYEEGLLNFIAKLKERKIKQKLLSCKGDKFRLDEPHLEYRSIPKKFFSPNPIYCYGDTVATVVWGPPRQAAIIKNPQIADAFKKQFLFIWDKAERLKT